MRYSHPEPIFGDEDEYDFIEMVGHEEDSDFQPAGPALPRSQDVIETASNGPYASVPRPEDLPTPSGNSANANTSETSEDYPPTLTMSVRPSTSEATEARMAISIGFDTAIETLEAFQMNLRHEGSTNTKFAEALQALCTLRADPIARNVAEAVVRCNDLNQHLEQSMDQDDGQERATKRHVMFVEEFSDRNNQIAVDAQTGPEPHFTDASTAERVEISDWGAIPVAALALTVISALSIWSGRRQH